MLIDAQLRRFAIHGVTTFVDVTAGRNWVKPLDELGWESDSIMMSSPTDDYKIQETGTRGIEQAARYGVKFNLELFTIETTKIVCRYPRAVSKSCPGRDDARRLP